MKNDRQAMILEILGRENIETQEQLLERLRERGQRLWRAEAIRGPGGAGRRRHSRFLAWPVRSPPP